MNISRRLTKIEEKLNVSNSGAKYCDCWKKHLDSIFDAIRNEEAGIETQTEIHPEPDFGKGFCARCIKPISKEDSVRAQDMADFAKQIEVS
jgi:hypothetical protein